MAAETIAQQALAQQVPAAAQASSGGEELLQDTMPVFAQVVEALRGTEQRQQADAQRLTQRLKDGDPSATQEALVYCLMELTTQLTPATTRFAEVALSTANYNRVYAEDYANDLLSSDDEDGEENAPSESVLLKRDSDAFGKLIQTLKELTEKNIEKYAGVRRFRYGEAETEDQVGVVTGLAWTEVGGELLSIESVMLPGKGRMTTTGKLGDVMKESIEAASSFVRSRAPAFGIKPPLFERKDIHVHVPEGATPKDGPSAGCAMVTSIVSVLTGIPVRREVAMTGEITLRGRVLPIGGLKEKLLAALRGGIKTVLIPADNAKDLAEIPDNVKKDLKIIPASTIDEVLKVALVNMPEPIEWDEAKELAAAAPEAGRDDGKNVLTH
jgi:hypothetical protein